MNWDHLRYFLALARDENLTAASRRLGVQHSTIARRVDQLEGELGLRLFDRLPRGWRLTPEGRGLVAQAEQVEHEIQGLRRAASGLDRMAGPVRISAPPLLASQVLLGGLAALRRAHPELTPELVGELREASLVGGEADIAVRLGRPVEHTLVARPAGEIGYALFGSPEQVARPAELQVFIGLDDELPALPQRQWLDEHVGARRIVLRSNDFGTMSAAARAGWGIALLPCFVGRLAGLQRLGVAHPPPSRPIYLLTHVDVRRADRVRVVADALYETLSGARESLAA